MTVIKQGMRGEEVRTLQFGLQALGYSPGMVDGIFGPGTEMALESFQTANKLLSDGVAGHATLGAYNVSLDALAASGRNPEAVDYIILIEVTGGDPAKSGGDLAWVKCPADKFEGRGGYDYLRMREDAAEAYNALYEAVHGLGGIMTSAGGRRPLSTKSNPSRSRKSFHYTGLAFDLSTETAMRDPEVDPYLIEQDDSDDSGRTWRVWVACDDNPEIVSRPINAVVASSRKDAKGKRYTHIETRVVQRRVVNFTKLAKDHGFQPIRCRTSFLRGGTYMGAEWWHHQYTAPLTKGVSTFGGELRRVYSLEKCQGFVYWEESKECRFGVDWF